MELHDALNLHLRMLGKFYYCSAVLLKCGVAFGYTREFLKLANLEAWHLFPLWYSSRVLHDEAHKLNDFHTTIIEVLTSHKYMQLDT